MIDDFKVPNWKRRHSWRDLEVLAQILEPPLDRAQLITAPESTRQVIYP